MRDKIAEIIKTTAPECFRFIRSEMIDQILALISQELLKGKINEKD